MRGQKIKSGIALFSLALLLVPAFALAQLGVEAAPLDGNFDRPLYLLEARDYTLSAKNTSSDVVRDFEVTISAPQGLSLPVNSGGHVLRVFTFPSIGPNEVAQKQFQVRADFVPLNPPALLTQYSQGAGAVSLSTPIAVVQSPVSVSAAARRGALFRGGAQSIVAAVSNDSNYPARNVRAELIAGSDNFGNAPLELKVLASHESAEREFTFRQPENPATPVVLRVLFEDSSGRHMLELPVRAPAGQVGGNVVLLIIAAVAIIVGYAIFSKKGGGAKGHAKAAVHAKKNDTAHSEGHGEGHH